MQDNNWLKFDWINIEQNYKVIVDKKVQATESKSLSYKKSADLKILSLIDEVQRLKEMLVQKQTNQDLQIYEATLQMEMKIRKEREVMFYS